MSSNVVNTTPFLRTSREFPYDDAHQLSVEVNKSYVDIANTVNNRTISLFPTTRPAINGESWYLAGQKQQGFRQVYTFTAAGNIAHGITTSQIFAFTRIYGTIYDSSANIWYPIPYVSATAANNQISISVTSTNIVITAGAGTPPTISKGYVVLEWISNV